MLAKLLIAAPIYIDDTIIITMIRLLASAEAVVDIVFILIGLVVTREKDESQMF